jgi:hypothetical protein
LDYQGNTRKERDREKTDKKVKEKHITKVVTGEVVQKPKGIGRKFKEIFFGGDAKQAVKFVSADVLLPALRNLLVDMVTKGAERMVYGESSYRRRPPSINYGARYQLNSPFNRDPRYDSPMRPTTLGPPPRTRQNRHDMNDVILGTKEEAELVVERLIDILDKYDVAALADLYDLLGLETSHIDNKWGWTYLGNVQVRQIRQGYLLELPPLEEI